MLFDEWYDEVIKSPNLDNVPIIVGSEFQNPVILTRNDAKGAFGIWAQKEISGYWDIRVDHSGFYDITPTFEKPVESDGNLMIRIGNVQRSLKMGKAAITGDFTKLWLEKGDYMIEAGLRNFTTSRVEFPFYVEIKRQENDSNSNDENL